MHTHFLDLQNIFIYPLTCLNRGKRFVPPKDGKVKKLKSPPVCSDGYLLVNLIF